MTFPQVNPAQVFLGASALWLDPTQDVVLSSGDVSNITDQLGSVLFVNTGGALPDYEAGPPAAIYFNSLDSEEQILLAIGATDGLDSTVSQYLAFWVRPDLEMFTAAATASATNEKVLLALGQTAPNFRAEVVYNTTHDGLGIRLSADGTAQLSWYSRENALRPAEWSFVEFVYQGGSGTLELWINRVRVALLPAVTAQTVPASLAVVSTNIALGGRTQNNGHLTEFHAAYGQVYISTSVPSTTGRDALFDYKNPGQVRGANVLAESAETPVDFLGSLCVWIDPNKNLRTAVAGGGPGSNISGFNALAQSGADPAASVRSFTALATTALARETRSKVFTLDTATGSALTSDVSAFATARFGTGVASAESQQYCAVWVRFDALPSSVHDIMSCWLESPNQRRFRFRIYNTGDVGFLLSEDGTAQTTYQSSHGVTWQTGRWYFIEAWFNTIAGEIVGAIDGVESPMAVTSGSPVATLHRPTGSDIDIVLGGYQTGPSTHIITNVNAKFAKYYAAPIVPGDVSRALLMAFDRPDILQVQTGTVAALTAPTAFAAGASHLASEYTTGTDGVLSAPLGTLVEGSTDLTDLNLGRDFPIPTIPNHCGLAQSHLLPWYQTKPLVEEVVCQLVDPLQELEDQFQGMLLARDVRLADTARLTVIGKLIGQGLTSTSVEGNRRLILGRVVSNVSIGSYESLKRIWDTIAPEFPFLTYQPGGATVHFYLEDGEDLTQALEDALVPNLTRGLAAGVNGVLLSPAADLGTGYQAELDFASVTLPGTYPGAPLPHVIPLTES